MAVLALFVSCISFPRGLGKMELNAIAFFGCFIRYWERSKGCSSLRVYCCLVKTTGFRSSVFETRRTEKSSIHTSLADLVSLALGDTSKFSRGSSSFQESRATFGGVVLSLGLFFCLLYQGRESMSMGCWWAEPESDCCWAWVWVILATENCGSRPVAAFLAGREVDRQGGSKQLGCQGKLVHMLSLAGKLLVPGLATILTGKAEWISYRIQHTYSVIYQDR